MCLSVNCNIAATEHVADATDQDLLHDSYTSAYTPLTHLSCNRACNNCYRTVSLSLSLSSTHTDKCVLWAPVVAVRNHRQKLHVLSLSFAHVRALNGPQVRLQTLCQRYHGQELWDVPLEESVGSKEKRPFQQSQHPPPLRPGLGHRWVSPTELDWGEVGGWVPWVRRSELCVREKPVCHILRFTVSHVLGLVTRWGMNEFECVVEDHTSF